MVDVSSQNNSVSINVSTGGNSANINATPDMAQYYSEKSREWAISNRIVDNTDYSSKYYANKADQSALSAKNYAQLAENSYSQFQGSVDSAIGNINSSAQTAINAIDLKGEEEKEAINTVAQGAVAGVKQESQIQMSTIQQVSQLEQEEIQEIINRIDDGKAVYVGENEPTDPVYSVWVDTNDDEVTLDVEEIATDIKNTKTDLNGKITNCITEIPQRIKLEIVDGKCVLKAGSIVTFPDGLNSDGSFKFIERDVTSDINLHYATGSGNFFLQITNDSNISYRHSNVTTCISGATPQTLSLNNYVWYDTANNLMKVSTDKGVTWTTRELSLPLGIEVSDGTKSTDIKQVFNGFGYFSSTVWVDKGVKGLIPNGRNEDGTLNNREFTTSKIMTVPARLDNTGIIKLGVNSSVITTKMNGWTFIEQDEQPKTDDITKYTCWYSPKDNIYRDTIDTGVTWNEVQYIFPVWYFGDTTRVTSLHHNQPFRAVDYNDLQNGTRFRTVVETYVNGGSWYRVWSDGWCEQGGNTQGSSTVSVSIITLLKPFKDKNYTTIALPNASSSTGVVFNDIDEKTNAKFTIRNSSSSYGFNWEAKGYIS